MTPALNESSLQRQRCDRNMRQSNLRFLRRTTTHVTPFSTDSNFWPVSNFPESCAYSRCALLCALAWLCKKRAWQYVISVLWIRWFESLGLIFAYTSGHREHLRTRVLYITVLGSLASHTLCTEEGADKLSLRNAIIEHKFSHPLNTLWCNCYFITMDAECRSNWSQQVAAMATLQRVWLVRL